VLPSDVIGALARERQRQILHEVQGTSFTSIPRSRVHSSPEQATPSRHLSMPTWRSLAAGLHLAGPQAADCCACS